MTQEVRLTNDLAVMALKPDDGQRYAIEFKDPDHPGLYLRLSYGGSKQFFFRYKRNQRQHKIGLGKYGQVTCAEAFETYSKHRKAVDRGEHPAAEINTPRSPGGMTVARLFDDHYKPRYLSKLRDQRTALLFDLHARAAIGKRPATKVTAEEITDIIAPLEETHYHTARKLLSLLRHMYKWATSSKVGLISCLNPCTGFELDAHTPKQPEAIKRNEIKRIWNALPGTPAGRAIKVQFLTGCRGGEVAGMLEGELDREARTWRIPAGRNKGKRLHIVPLTETALDLIGESLEGVVFPAPGKAPHLTRNGMYQALKRTCIDIGVPRHGTHAIRRTVATLLDELQVPGVVADRILNHTPASLREQRYSAHKYINEKREALERLEQKILSIVWCQ